LNIKAYKDRIESERELLIKENLDLCSKGQTVRPLLKATWKADISIRKKTIRLMMMHRDLKKNLFSLSEAKKRLKQVDVSCRY